MPAGFGEATEMIGPITPALMCWASLIITVVALLLGFLFTNVTAFAKLLRGGRRKPTSGSTTEDSGTTSGY